jgi:hypothetical protein
MAKDYGGGGGRKGGATRGVVLAFVAVAIVGVAVFAWREHQRGAAEEARVAAFWTVQGQPCAAISAAEIAGAARPPNKKVEFEAGRIVRSYGDGACREFEGGLAKSVGGDLVCQFSAPGWLEVRAGSGAPVYYAVGPGSATVVIADSGARCVRGANLRPGMALP